MKCKWYAEFEGVCTNGECPYRGDTCPTSEHPEVCKHAEEDPEIPRLNVAELVKTLRLCDSASCTGCALYGFYDCGSIINPQAADMLEKLAAERDAKKPEWIKTEIQRPSEGTDVLMLYKHNIVLGFLRDKNDPLSWLYYIDDVSCTDCDGEPICWIPLPELLKEEER
jgi:hypothetical protein